MELKTFKRFVGPGGLPLLGSDTAPTALVATADTLFRLQHTAHDDEVIAGLVCGYHYTGGGPAPTINVDVYLYDFTTKLFFLVGRTAFAPDAVTYVDLPGIVQTDPASGVGFRPGSIEVVFVPIAAGGEPVGTYEFGAVFSTFGGAADAVRVIAAVLPPNAATETTLKKISGDTAGTNVHSAALEASHVISAAACKVRSVKALNNSGAPLWLHIFDLAALPANGTVPDRCPIPVPAGDVNGDVWQGSTGFANGCVVALSSTLATLTVIVANDGWFDAEVV